MPADLAGVRNNITTGGLIGGLEMAKDDIGQCLSDANNVKQQILWGSQEMCYAI